MFRIPIHIVPIGKLAVPPKFVKRHTRIVPRSGVRCVARNPLRTRHSQLIMRIITNDDLLPCTHVDVTPWLVEQNVDVLGLGVREHFFEILLATYPRVFQAAKTRSEKVG